MIRCREQQQQQFVHPLVLPRMRRAEQLYGAEGPVFVCAFPTPPCTEMDPLNKQNEIQMTRTTLRRSNAKWAHLAEPVRPGRVALEVEGGAGSQDVADFNLLGMNGNGGAQHKEGN